MIKHLFLSTVAAIALSVSSFASQIGDTIQSVVTTDNRVSLPSQLQPTQITNIVLDSGVWSISGQVNVLSFHTPNGPLFTAANISVSTPSFEPDGTSSVQVENLVNQGNVIRPMALTPRVVEVANNTPVFLVGGVFLPNSQVTAWGFISAVKVRNHVP